MKKRNDNKAFAEYCKNYEATFIKLLEKQKELGVEAIKRSKEIFGLIGKA